LVSALFFFFYFRPPQDYIKLFGVFVGDALKITMQVQFFFYLHFSLPLVKKGFS